MKYMSYLFIFLFSLQLISSDEKKEELVKGTRYALICELRKGKHRISIANLEGEPNDPRLTSEFLSAPISDLKKSVRSNGKIAAIKMNIVTLDNGELFVMDRSEVLYPKAGTVLSRQGMIRIMKKHTK